MSLTDLGNLIDRKQPKPFVDLYLTCLAQGFQLHIPTEKDVVKNIQKWDVILSKFRNNFSDEFCEGVATYWLSLLNQCDVHSAQIEEDLCKAAGINPDQKEAPQKTTEPDVQQTTEYEIPTSKKHSGDPLTHPHISERYQQRRMAESINMPELEQLVSTYNKSFKSKDPIKWLISHLTFAKYEQPKPVPKSTVPANIREQWEGIIADEFNTIATDDFLTELTNDWFYLVNQKGIPTRAEQMHEVLMIYLARQQSVSGQPKKQPKSKKKGLFQQLFGA
jgi:hypothetical protein